MIHPTKILGYSGSIEELAQAVAKMRYDCVLKFVKELTKEFKKEAAADKRAGRTQLASLLQRLVADLDASKTTLDLIWKLSKKFM